MYPVLGLQPLYYAKWTKAGRCGLETLFPGGPRLGFNLRPPGAPKDKAEQRVSTAVPGFGLPNDFHRGLFFFFLNLEETCGLRRTAEYPSLKPPPHWFFQCQAGFPGQSCPGPEALQPGASPRRTVRAPSAARASLTPKETLK